MVHLGEMRALGGRPREIQRVLSTILWLNLGVAAAKAVVGIASGSLAVASDAIHSLLDAAANVVGMIALRLAATPPDAGHPYGHRKVEIVASVFVGVLIAGGSLRFAVSAVEALLSGQSTVRATGPGFLVLGVTLGVNLLVARYEAQRGRRLQSPFLLADAAHTASDVLVSVAVIASLLATRVGIRWADPICALLVLAVIARVAWRILSDNLGILLDRAVIDADLIKTVVVAVAGVAGCHRVRSRGVDGAIQIDLHLALDGALSLHAAHAISHMVESTLREKFQGIADVTIHIEPDSEPEEGL
jgi:cation diffusion facilitator family transporter